MDLAVRTLNLVNDVSDCSMKLLQDFSGKITKDDTECQDLFHSIEQQRKTKTQLENVFKTELLPTL